MKIGMLGSGDVARTLATGFIGYGHHVMMGTRERATLDAWAGRNPRAIIGSFEDAATFGEVVVLAVKGAAAASAVRLAGPSRLAGKVVIDTTNPIADAPPVNGVLRFFTTLDESLMERLQREFADVRFVKAFSSVGHASMVNPAFEGGRPTMFICGNDEAARATVSAILGEFGWDTADMGMATAARAIEPLCMLWCIPGFLHGSWAHAFTLLRRP